jgi:hypothetical protein
VRLQWQSSLPAQSVSLVRGSPDSDRGWRAAHYLELEPARSFLLTFALLGSLTVRTKLLRA